MCMYVCMCMCACVCVCVCVCAVTGGVVSDSSPCSQDGDVTKPIHSFVLAVLSDNPTIREYLAHLGTGTSRLSATTNRPNNGNTWLIILPRIRSVQIFFKQNLLKEPHKKGGNLTTDLTGVSLAAQCSEQQVFMNFLRTPSSTTLSFTHCLINLIASF